jgi:glycerol-3-phosphate dehydrogenase
VLDNINRCLQLKRPLAVSDVIAERCGVRPLAVRVGAGASARDFLQLSRRHAIEVNRARAHISIFGGKLTDCINVGEEICREVAELGILIPQPKRRWYGEPGRAAKEKFLAAARALDLDSHTAAGASEPLSERFWRRYGEQAQRLLEVIRSDPSQVRPLIEGGEFSRCEIGLVAEREMIVRLEDFLRRRSKMALLLRPEELYRAPGLREACQILFGAPAAAAKFDDYFAIDSVNHRSACLEEERMLWQTRLF